MTNKNVINVNKLMHENAVLGKKHKKVRFKVSPDAVYEYSSRMVDRIIDFMPRICEVTLKHNHKTVTAEDIIEFLSIYGRDIV